ncbi:MAG: hypothetical protein PVI90_14355, partial [Desulfobacteraceae bacterium]
GNLFSEDQIPNIKLVVSARLTASAPNAKAWLNRLGWNASGIHSDCLIVPPLNREDLINVLEKMGCPLDELVGEVDIITELHRLTLGDPLLVGLYVEDLWDKRDTAASLKPHDLKKLSSGFGGYFHKWFDDQKKLWENKSPLREKDTLGVLAILACALGPLRDSEIIQLIHLIYNRKIYGVFHIIKPLERFVISDPDSDSYTLSHPKLSEFLTSSGNHIVDTAMISDTKKGFLIWGRKTLSRLRENEITTEEVEYLLFYYTHHLIRENAPIEDFMALVEDGWRRAWYAYEGGYYGFANDITTVLKQVKDAAKNLYKQQHNNKIEFFAEQFRCVYCLSSIRNIGANISGKLLKLAIECNIFSDQQAINLISLKTDPGEYTSSLIEIADTVRVSNLPKLLEAARNISDESSRANALSGLASYLSDDLKVQALEVARNISDESSRADALIGLVPHLSNDLKRQVFEAASNIGDEWHRAHTLLSLASLLSDDLKVQALEVARNIDDKEYRAKALIDLAPHFSDELKFHVVSEAFEMARNINDKEYRAKALIDFAPHLSDELKFHVVLEAFEAVCDISNEKNRVDALICLAVHLPDDLKPQVVKYWLETAVFLKRGELLETAIPLINTIKNYISREDISKIFKIIHEVSKWWP